EAESANIRLDDDELPLVRRMIDFLYKLDYSDEGEPPNPSSEYEDGAVIRESPPTDLLECSALTVHARMYAIADKYQIPGLKDLSKRKFSTTVTDKWNNESFSHAVRVVYNSTPQNDRGLRDVVARIGREHIHALRDRGEFKCVLREVNDFTLNVLNLAVNDLPTRILPAPAVKSTSTPVRS
ncbi:MAG: hypothetical protein M1826_003896, partial [Phylliscum demangeonii]